MKLNIKKMIGLGLVSFFSQTYFFAAQAQTAKYVEPWGMGGCGFGSLFIKEKNQLPQLGAWFLNYYISGMTQSSNISSGTSNCVATKPQVAAKEQQDFILVNLASLSKEAAQGSGEHILALAEIFGCPHDTFAQLSQTHYKSIYGVNDPQSVFTHYVKEVHGNQKIAKECTRTI